MNSILERALEEGDHKPLWKYCKSQRQDNIGVAPLKENGQLHSDSQKRSEILARQFKSDQYSHRTDKTHTRMMFWRGLPIPPP